MNIVNLSFYKFTPFSPELLVELRASLLEKTKSLGLKGTILLAQEGFNSFIAGSREAIDAFKATVETIPGMTELPYKESLSDEQPFTRMLVKIKKEIITMGCPEVRPSDFTGPRVSAKELKSWLDQGREVVFLDTRNDYEIRVGTFENALDLNLKTFRQFPDAVRKMGDDVKNKTVVSFCTGGIRCEKASAFLINEGFKDVYQLDGGILRYFEEVGGSYFKGECFVFDHRVGVDANLNETPTVLCYNCQNPVTLEEQRTAAYVPEVSCPHCLGRPKEHKELIAQGLKA